MSDEVQAGIISGAATIAAAFIAGLFTLSGIWLQWHLNQRDKQHNGSVATSTRTQHQQQMEPYHLVIPAIGVSAGGLLAFMVCESVFDMLGTSYDTVVVWIACLSTVLVGNWLGANIATACFRERYTPATGAIIGGCCVTVFFIVFAADVIDSLNLTPAQLYIGLSVVWFFGGLLGAAAANE